MDPQETYGGEDLIKQASLLMDFLNTPVKDIAGKDLFTLVLTPQGYVFSVGKDYRDESLSL